MAESGSIKGQGATISTTARARVERTKSLREINAQVSRISKARDAERFGKALDIAANYRENIRKTPEYRNGRWENGVFTSYDIQFPRSIYAATRKNNR